MIHDTWADNADPIAIEIYYGGDWHDITDDLGDDGVQITRGRSSWSGHADPAELSLTLSSPSGTYSPRNPNSPLYGLIGRNTPIRVMATTNSVTYTRFYGEVSAWPQKWTTKGTAYATIEAAGVTRRLGQGASPLKSAYRRGCTSTVAPVVSLTEYWPMEDSVGSTSFASGLAGGPTMSIAGSADLSSDEASFACSAPLPVATAGWSSYGRIRPVAATGELQARLLVAVPSGGVPAKTRIFELSTTGLASRWMISVDTSGNLYLDAYDSSGAALVASGAIGFGVNGDAFRLGLTLEQNGSDIDWTFSVLNVGAGVGYYWADTLASKTIGSGVGMLLAPDSALTGCTVGHVTVQTSATGVFDLEELLNAHSGETAAARVTRLCAEEGITDTITGTAAASELMGYQLRASLLDLLGECEATDLGALHEPRASAGLQYRVRDSVCAQDPAVTITYTDNLLLPFEPVEDDRLTRNLVKVTRIGGTSSTSEVTSGPLNTSDPIDDPDGVGRYDEAIDLSLHADAQTAGQAQWRTHVGTVDEARWPQVGIELAHPTLRADTALTAAVLGLDIGDRMVVTDPPEWLPPDDVDQVVCGYDEEITPTRYKITLRCVPYSPYRILVWDNTDSRWSGDGTVLAEDLDATETGIDVTAPAGVEWTHADGDYDVLTGGERMTVTGIAGAAPDYTFTVTRSVNGVVKSHSSGAAIDVAAPVFYGL